jgi:hypothetical protein
MKGQPLYLFVSLDPDPWNAVQCDIDKLPFSPRRA